jgi:hypothetical protein
MSIPIRPDEDEDVFICDTLRALEAEIERLTAEREALRIAGAELKREVEWLLAMATRGWDRETVDRALNLLVNASRVDPVLRQAVATVEARILALEARIPDPDDLRALSEIVRMPNAEHVADRHNLAVRRLRALLPKENDRG